MKYLYVLLFSILLPLSGCGDSRKELPPGSTIGLGEDGISSSSGPNSGARSALERNATCANPIGHGSLAGVEVRGSFRNAWRGNGVGSWRLKKLYQYVSDISGWSISNVIDVERNSGSPRGRTSGSVICSSETSNGLIEVDNTGILEISKSTGRYTHRVNSSFTLPYLNATPRITSRTVRESGTVFDEEPPSGASLDAQLVGDVNMTSKLYILADGSLEFVVITERDWQIQYRAAIYQSSSH